MKKETTTATSRKKATGKASSKAGAKPASEVHSMANDVIKYLESHAKNLDKATIAKYVAVAVIVLYGIRKSNILGGLSLSIITAIVSKFMADKFEGDFVDIIPSSSEAKG